jgi:hypothetical protein
MPAMPAMHFAHPLRVGLVLALTVGVVAATAQTTQNKQTRQRRGPPPKVELTLPPAPGEQLAAAAMAYFGNYECEFDEKVSIDVNRKFDGYLDVVHRKNTWIMKPVLSQTGALRLEDVRGRMLMLQIANKSMLMDTKIGQRVVDNCVHPKQREAMANRKTEEESIGIDPVKTAAAEAALAAASSAAATSAAASAPTAAAAAPAPASAPN